MNAIIFDTETTSAADDKEVIETAWMPINIAGEMLPGGGQVDRWKPSKPISIGAMAVHNIIDEDLERCPPSSEFRLPDGVEYLVGFKVDFDWQAIGSPEGIKRIDLLAMCRHLWPTADSHTQSAMMFHLMPHRIAQQFLSGRVHSAGVDVVNCHRVLERVLDECGPFANFDDLWNASEFARIPTVLSSGKHKGMKVADVPQDYKRWLLSLPDLDEYMRRALTR